MAINYTDYDRKYLDKEVLTQDEDFLRDASNFLAKRNNQAVNDPEEVYDSFMKHMRYHEANEVTAIRDLMYVQEADASDKLEFGRLINTFDRMEGESFTDAAGDYIEAGLTSPSTWIGLLTGGLGKMTALAATQTAKTGVRAVLGGAAKKLIGSPFMKAPDAVKGAVVEGAFGLGAGAAQEGARVEVGEQEEFTGGRTLTTGLTQAVAGALPAGLYGLQQGKAATKALDMRQAGKEASSASEAAATENVKKELSSIQNKDKITVRKEDILGEEVMENLSTIRAMQKDPLNPELVAEGTAILKGMSSAARTLAGLSDEVLDKITAASFKIEKAAGLTLGKEPITAFIAKAMREGNLKDETFKQILKDFNLDQKQFSYVYLAHLSKAGRDLGQAGQISKSLFKNDKGIATGKAAVDAAQKQSDRLVQAVSEYMEVVGGKVSKDDLLEIVKDAEATQKPVGFFRNLDRFRLGMMTGQLATTMRNVAGGGFRVAMDVFDTSFKNLLRVGKEYDDPLAVSKYLLFNQSEAKVVRELFTEGYGMEADKFFGTFLESATMSARMGGDTKLSKLGATVNTLNRVSDNIYKQAIFAGRLDQIVRRTMKKNVDGKAVERSLADVIADGDFKLIPEESMQDAIEKSLEFVYQAAPKGKNIAADVGRGLIKYHQKLPFLVSAFMPFPRFVINQVDFVNAHMPIIGLLGNAVQKKSFNARTAEGAEMYAQQLTGVGMLSVAYDMRSRQGPETEWYEYVTEDGKSINMMPIAGPFNAFLLAADYLYRTKEGLKQKPLTEQMKAAFQALGGPSFRAGTGLYTIDRLVEDSLREGEPSDKIKRAMARTAGDIINTFTLPLATVRDLVSLSDDQMRYLPRTTYVDYFDVIAAHATKSLPSIPGIPEVSLSEFMSDTFGSGEIDIEQGNIDMVTGRSRKVIDPFEKQLFGFGKSAPKTNLQKTLVRLQMQPYALYKKSDYPYEDRLIKEVGAKEFAKRLNLYVKTPKFLNQEPAMQTSLLKKEAATVLKEIKKKVKVRLNEEQAANSVGGAATQYDEVRFSQLPRDLRNTLTEEYRSEYPDEEKEDFNATKAMALLPSVRAKVKALTSKAEGGYIGKYALGGLLRSADEVVELGAKKSDDVGDTLSDAEYEAMLDEDMLELGYPEEVDEKTFFDLDKKTLDNLETAGELALETLIGFTPIVGDVYDAYNVTNNLRNAKYVDAAIDAVGFVPFIGNALSKGIKVSLDMFKNTDPLIKKRALADFVRTEGRIPDLKNTADIEGLASSGAKQEKIVAGMANSDIDMPLFHGTGNADPIVDPKGRSKHGELGTGSLSTSRDPLLALDNFAGGNPDGMNVLTRKRSPGLGERAGTSDMRPGEYDARRAKQLDLQEGGREFIQESEMLPTQLPRTAFAEAETMVQNLDDVEVSKLKDNPKLLKKVLAGKKDLERVYERMAELDAFNPDALRKFNVTKPKEAMEYYTKTRKMMRAALDLAKYTSGAGARGTYDVLLNNISKNYFIMKEAANTLGNTQRGKVMRDLALAMEQLAEHTNDISISAQEAADLFPPIKKRIMDATDKMNRGGLATRRT